MPRLNVSLFCFQNAAKASTHGEICQHVGRMDVFLPIYGWKSAKPGIHVNTKTFNERFLDSDSKFNCLIKLSSVIIILAKDKK